MNRPLLISLAAAAILGSGCDHAGHEGPPSIAYASDVCDQCNMIISDERFAAAMRVVEPDGYTRSVVFDDLNCMVRFESLNDGLTVHARWTHDFATNAWLDVGAASFVQSDDLATPMGSHIAGFALEADATAAAEQLGGTLVSWESLRAEFTSDR